MRFHVCALPHTHTTTEFISCAYTAKVISFCRMMFERGHEVYLYGGEKNEAPCTEHIVCVNEQQRLRHVGDRHFTSASFDRKLPFWQCANMEMAAAIRARLKPKDFVCLIGGVAQQPITEMVPADAMSVEYGIGYAGVFAKYKVFESYAWMHTVYGALTGGNAAAADGQFFDAVIPGYLDMAQFPISEEKDDYYLFMGRLIDRKGYGIAVEVCKALGKRLVVCGQGDPPPGVDYRGVVGPEERGRLMSRAKAVFVPTIYVEPFANVHVEAMACGTPVITTDWGVFTETVIDGVNGFRCRTFAEFKRAAENVERLSPRVIRNIAEKRYSLGVVGEQYEKYFTRLLTLWDKGWYNET